MATQLGLYASGMHGRSAHATPTVPLIESNSEKNVRGLGASVGNERLVGRCSKVGIVEVDVGEAMPRRRQIDQPSAGAE
jgi:hypothetical protein